MASNGIDCYVKLQGGKTISLNLVSGDVVSTIYNRVAEEESVSSDRVLLKYTGKVLNRSHTVGYLGICKETILKAEVLTVKKLNIYVKLNDGKTIPVQIENVSPIRLIKDHIQMVEGIDSELQVLKKSGVAISNTNQKCVDVGMTDECILTLEVKEPVAATETSPAENETKPAMNEQDKEAVISSFDACGKQVEVVFSFDTTGSMYSCLEQVRSKLSSTVSRLLEHIPSVRIGIMAHGDYCDEGNYVCKSTDLTSDQDRLVDFVQQVEATEGGDAPECYEWVLRKAQELDWSENSAKALVMIGDDIPHCPSYTDQNLHWQEELDVLIGMGIKVYGIRADHGNHSVNFYQALAERSGGAYITFSNFDIIADMFLAVCYREASDDQFEDFCEEVTAEAAQGSKKAEDVKNMLEQIEQSAQNPPASNDRYVNAPWWDPKLDQGCLRYVYDSEKDKWMPYSRAKPTTEACHSASASPVKCWPKLKRSKGAIKLKSCSVM